MIPKLTLDEESIKKNWTKKKDQEWVKKHCEIIGLCIEDSNHNESNIIPVYQCDENWVDLGVFKEYKNISKKYIKYGYCDREEDLEQYLQTYLKDPVNNYFIHLELMSLDYEKYYKNGSYINKLGEDTKDDYWPYINLHPEEKDRQQFPGCWITFSIHELK